MSEPFIGEIRIWACNYAPRNWALCNGGFIPISENTALFSIIGTMYGGDGRTTMKLPNLQGRAPMAWGQAPGLSYHIQGESSGWAEIPLTEDNIPSHNHVITGVKASGTSGSPDTSLFMGLDTPSTGDNIVYLSKTDTPNTSLAEETLGTAGSSVSHENMQPYLTVNFCIALAGIYPTRN